MGQDQSSAGPDHGQFDKTRWSMVLEAVQSQAPGAPKALAELCGRYWRPLYAFARRRGCTPWDAQQDLPRLERLFGRRGQLPLSGELRGSCARPWHRTTAVRRTAKHQLLNQEEPEKALRFLRLFRKALSVFKTEEAAVNWFQTKTKALGDKTPLEFAKTEPGARLVENILGRILEGVFS
jgi:hypothetical protein